MARCDARRLRPDTRAPRPDARRLRPVARRSVAPAQGLTPKPFARPGTQVGAYAQNDVPVQRKDKLDHFLANQASDLTAPADRGDGAPPAKKAKVAARLVTYVPSPLMGCEVRERRSRLGMGPRQKGPPHSCTETPPSIHSPPASTHH